MTGMYTESIECLLPTSVHMYITAVYSTYTEFVQVSIDIYRKQHFFGFYYKTTALFVVLTNSRKPMPLDSHAQSLHSS